MKKALIIAVAVLGTAQAGEIQESRGIQLQIQQQQQNMLKANALLAQDRADYKDIIGQLRVEKNKAERENLMAQKKEIEARQKLHQQNVQQEIAKLNEMNEQAKPKAEPQSTYTQLFLDKVKSAFSWVKSILPNPFA